MGRAHRNVAIVAFANKLARIAWAVLRRGERFCCRRRNAPRRRVASIRARGRCSIDEVCERVTTRGPRQSNGVPEAWFKKRRSTPEIFMRTPPERAYLHLGREEISEAGHVGSRR